MQERNPDTKASLSSSESGSFGHHPSSSITTSGLLVERNSFTNSGIWGSGTEPCSARTCITFIVNSTGSAGAELELYAKVHFLGDAGSLFQIAIVSSCGMKTFLP
jgi:hypothetical protein